MFSFLRKRLGALVNRSFINFNRTRNALKKGGSRAKTSVIVTFLRRQFAPVGLLLGAGWIGLPATHLPLKKIEHPIVLAPNVPPPTNRRYPARVKVVIPVHVKEMPIDEVHNYEFWTFGGGVPGPFIRTRVGDILDITLQNFDESGMLHNLDFHAVTGPGGGAPLLLTDYGTMTHASFKLLHPGLFIYHCAVAPVGAHVGNGMYGLILVEPQEGLPPVDKEFYVVQGDFYTEAIPKSTTLQQSELHALSEKPSHVVFNGKVGSLTKGNTLQVNTNDRVRIYFGNGGPNLVSSFHVIGTIFDKVYREGDLLSPPARSIQTTLVPAGGAAVVEMDLPVPGIYTLVDHSIWRIEKGAVGFIQAEGKPREDIYHSEEPPKICAGCLIHP